MLVTALFVLSAAYLLHSTAQVRILVAVPAIDHNLLVKAMAKSQVTTKRLADETGMSLQYMCDIVAGRRTLKRNPELRSLIAKALDVPPHWIEHQDVSA